jgi:1,4-alpha-glucan branching enzyme
MKNAQLCLVLHAHLPFVPCNEKQALEERWLFEAITETYVPLIMAMESWQRDALLWKFTLSISPTLAAMLTSECVQERYLSHLTQLMALSRREQIRLQGNSEFYPLAVYYEQRFEQIRSTWLSYGGDLTKAFANLAANGSLELITTTATHAFLPYVLTEEAVRAQIAMGVQSHEEIFGIRAQGMWLPECAYRPGVDDILREYGVQYSFVDTHAFRNAHPQPIDDIFAPVCTSGGVTWFARDPETAHQVWSSQGGYPGHPDYREFYRDIGYDLAHEDIHPYLTDGIRTDTGLKYYRVTGTHAHKTPYHPKLATQRAAEHAADFLGKQRDRAIHLAQTTSHPPVITSMYDAELFGHWWYEGPEFLNQLVRQMQTQGDGIQLTSPREVTEEAQGQVQQVELEMSSWGRGGYGDVWLNERNHEMYRTLHEMEREMTCLANDIEAAHPIEQRILNQSARELVLAQSSDWAFMKDNQTAVQYADARFQGHVRAFDDLAQMIRNRNWNLRNLLRLEHSDNLLVHMDYSLYRNRMSSYAGWDCRSVTPLDKVSRRKLQKGRVLMLSWEYPPEQVGGLARHVYHLAVALASANWEVHVVTRHTSGSAFHEVSEGVHVHRAVVKEPHGVSFLDWVFQMNLGMVQLVQQPELKGMQFDVLHAHDWLVATAGLAIQSMVGTPLVTTIHATEHGRNQGIRTELQRQIHSQEAGLAVQSDAVILCSRFMKEEVERIHSVSSHLLYVIPNGVALAGASDRLLGQRSEAYSKNSGMSTSKTVFFVGRMVREKGVDVLLQAVGHVLQAHPDTKFVLAGTGPMYEEWCAWGRMIGPQVEFIGFVTDEARDEWMRKADVCVFPSLYEPFGMVALEAVAAGTPVVASATGGLCEVVTHDVTGCVCEPGSPISLAEQIVRVLSNPSFGQTLVENARKAAMECFKWEQIAKSTSDVYARVLRQITQEEEVGIQ